MNRFSKLCALCAALAMSIATYAQSSLLATLSHVEEGSTTSQITTFYGKSGLSDAVAAAADGDVVTLSSGQFYSCAINKNISVRGAGCSAVAANYNQPTSIVGQIILEPSGNYTLENIECGSVAYKADVTCTFFKCSIGSIDTKMDEHAENTTLNIYNSVVRGKIDMGRYDARRYFGNNTNVTLINSIFGEISTSNASSVLEAKNCFIYQNPNHNSTTLTNCIVVTKGANLNGSLRSYNCLAIGDSPEGCFNDRGENNNVVSGYGIFKKYAEGCDLLYPTNFELTDAAAATYKGVDGKQVGLLGGSLPFDLTPMLPRITRLDTAPMSTTDGKLRVNIQVEVPTPSSTE